MYINLCLGMVPSGWRFKSVESQKGGAYRGLS